MKSNIKNSDEEYFESVPEFIPPYHETHDEESTEEEHYFTYKKYRTEFLTTDEENLLQREISKPSKIFVEQSFATVSFDDYKGNLSSDFKEFNALYQNFNYWNEEAFFNILEYYSETDISAILKKIAYLPNHKFLPNFIELLGIEVQNGNIDFGNIIDNESVFQNFKRIYEERIQLVLIPFLLYTYNLDKKLIPIKKLVWQLFNKNSRSIEASLLMADIQRSLIRFKKAQEFLMQEGYNLQEKVNLNLNLLILTSDKNHFYYNIFQIFKEVEENKEIQDIQEIKETLILKRATELFEIKPLTPKPLTQQLLVYKLTDTGNRISNELINSNILENIPDVIVSNLGMQKITFKNANLIREIIFSITEVAKKKNIPVNEAIKQIFISVLNIFAFNDIKELKFLSYILAFETIAGVFKVKYNVDLAIQGLTSAVLELKDDKNSFFSKDYISKIIIEFSHQGLWDACVEVYPNLTLVEKYSDMFFNPLK